MTKRKAVYNPEADKKWAENNKEHRRYLTDRTSARRFIRTKAREEDLAELEELIALRKAIYPKILNSENEPLEDQ